jgi:hypothetical protein
MCICMGYIWSMTQDDGRLLLWGTPSGGLGPSLPQRRKVAGQSGTALDSFVLSANNTV